MQNQLPVAIQLPLLDIPLSNAIEWFSVPAQQVNDFAPLETKVGAIPANFFFSL